MFSRSWFAVMLLGAIGLPYLFTSTFGSSRSGQEQTGAAPAVAGLPDGAPVASCGVLDLNPTANNLADVFRWDVSPPWVLGRWPRVSAGLADVDLQGYRVPLVTGGQSDDLAGSLTYYFDRRQRLKRMLFQGSTGDGRRLVALLATRFGFVREWNNDPSLYLYRVRDGKKVVSELRIQPARVVRADSPHSRFDVALLIARPAGD
jgi:hypothetical protein